MKAKPQPDAALPLYGAVPMWRGHRSLFRHLRRGSEPIKLLDLLHVHKGADLCRFRVKFLRPSTSHAEKPWGKGEKASPTAFRKSVGRKPSSRRSNGKVRRLKRAADVQQRFFHVQVAPASRRDTEEEYCAMTDYVLTNGGGTPWRGSWTWPACVAAAPAGTRCSRRPLTGSDDTLPLL